MTFEIETNFKLAFLVVYVYFTTQTFPFLPFHSSEKEHQQIKNFSIKKLNKFQQIVRKLISLYIHLLPLPISFYLLKYLF